MKKALIVLLILGVTGGIFAQELSWSGNIQTGFVIDMGDSYKDPVIRADDDDIGVPVQARLNLDVAGGDWGLRFGTGADVTQDGTPEFVFGNAHGWIDFADGLLKLRAGLIDDKVWATGGEIDDDVSTGLGARIEVMPFGDMLNFGVFLNYDNESDPMTVKDWLASTAFGVSFDYEEIMNLKFAVAMKMSPEKIYTYEELIDDSDPIEENWVYESIEATEGINYNSKLVFMLGISPIPMLNILIDGNALKLGGYNEAGTLTVYEEITFSGVEDLLAGVLLGQGFSSKSKENFNFYSEGHYSEYSNDEAAIDWFLIKPWVEYSINESWSAGLGVPIVLADSDGLSFASFGADLWGKYTIESAFAKIGYGFTKYADAFGGYEPPDFDHRGHANHYIRVTFGFSF